MRIPEDTFPALRASPAFRALAALLAIAALCGPAAAGEPVVWSIEAGSSVVAGGEATLVFRFEAREELAPRDTLEILLPICAPFSNAQWSSPHLGEGGEEGNAGRTVVDGPATLRVDPYPADPLCREQPIRRPDRYPWVIRLVIEETLRPGQVLRATYGDPGPEGDGRALAQAFPERSATFSARLRRADGGEVVDLTRRGPEVEVGRRPAERLHLSGPSEARPGERTEFLVAGLDSVGFPADSFPIDTRLAAEHENGTVIEPTGIDSGDDRCVRRATFAFPEPGAWWVRASHPALVAAWDLPVVVAEDRPARRLVWGDIHWHTNRSDGSRTPEEGYLYARNIVGLDFTARTDHDTHHLFDCLDEGKWQETIDDARRWNEPDRFVVLVGYEWTSGLGHMNAYYRGDAGDLVSASDYGRPPETWARLTPDEVITIPHHPAAVRQPTWNWKYHDERFVRPVEIYSNKGNSEMFEGPWSPVSQSVPKGRERAARLGTLQRGWSGGVDYTVLASTDTHYGSPGTPVLQRGARTRTGWAGSGLCAAWVERLGREDIWVAMSDGHTYGSTGPRIRVELEADPGEDGAVVGRVLGTTVLEDVELVGIPEEGEEPFPTVRAFPDGPHPRVREVRWERDDGDGIRGVYLRVFQEDGEMAWSTPVFFTE